VNHHQERRYAQSEERAFISLDLDFSDIRPYPTQDNGGIIVLRPAVQNITSLIRIMKRLLPLLNQQPLEGCLWVVDNPQVRIWCADHRPCSPRLFCLGRASSR